MEAYTVLSEILSSVLARLKLGAQNISFAKIIVYAETFGTYEKNIKSLNFREIYFSILAHLRACRPYAQYV